MKKINKPLYIGEQDQDNRLNDENSPDNREEQFEHGKHPNSLKALKKNQFAPGVSGNPGGRSPKLVKLKDSLSEYKDMQYDDAMDWRKEMTMTCKDRVLRTVWEKAGQGDEKMITLLANLGCLD
tara:strand:+ start:35 stop:406 length:372 start_codon:yes stop_codon:yes gene_type:complete